MMSALGAARRMRTEVTGQLSRHGVGATCRRHEDEITVMLVAIVVMFITTQTPALVTQVRQIACPRYFEDRPHRATHSAAEHSGSAVLPGGASAHALPVHDSLGPPQLDRFTFANFCDFLQHLFYFIFNFTCASSIMCR